MIGERKRPSDKALVDCVRLLAEQSRRQRRARIERRVDPRLDDARRRPRIGARRAVDQPLAARQGCRRRLDHVVPPTLRIELQREVERRPVAAPPFVQHRDILLEVRARPVPVVERRLERFVAEVRIEIAAVRATLCPGQTSKPRRARAARPGASGAALRDRAQTPSCRSSRASPAPARARGRARGPTLRRCRSPGCSPSHRSPLGPTMK